MFFKKGNLDKSNVLGSVKALSQQCTHAYEEANKIMVPENYLVTGNVVMCGMGGSGLGARVIEAVYKNTLKSPLLRVNDYTLPNYINFNSLVIASSYSGSTEETLANAKDAIAKKAPWMAIGTGGALIDLAKSERVPYYQIISTHNPSNEPRMAIGYSIIGQLVLAQKCGVIKFEKSELDLLVNAMNQVEEKLAREFAEKLKDKEIIFVSADFMDGAVHVWNNQINENAKTFSAHFSIPELNHHLMESLAHPKSNRREMIFVFVNTNLYTNEIKKRFRITADVVKQNGIVTIEFNAKSDNKLSATFEVIQFGAYVSYYLSALYKIDPGPIPWVDYFKEKMVEKEWVYRYDEVMDTAQYILPFNKISKKDIPSVGGKGANLGEMINHGFPVPNGFAITVAAYDHFIDTNNLAKRINDILSGIDVNENDQLLAASRKIQKIIIVSKTPADLTHEIIKTYKKLSGLLGHVAVAVRSSATAEDLPEASFAGQQATFLNIKGGNNLLVATKECWASLFTARAIFYRVQNKIKHSQVKISVIVQKMVQSEVSGVMFSVNPVTQDKETIVIEAVWGLGELIVQGSVTPDRYVVQKSTFAILSKEIVEQKKEMIRTGNGTKIVNVPQKIVDKPKLTNEEIVAMAHLAQKLHDHYFFPQDTEFAKSEGKLYIVQTRPITTLKNKRVAGTGNTLTNDVPVLVGTPASPGVGTGKVVIVKNLDDVAKVQKGCVLVAKMTSPDYVPAMKRAEAIVTNEGGLTSHAAIVSRELGVPCVVGTGNALEKLSSGDTVTVDATAGKVFLGAKKITIAEEKQLTHQNIKTATHVYVNLAEPERVKEIADRNVDGVGLLRAEFIIAGIGVHPKEAIKQKKQDKFIDYLADKIGIFCKAFHPRPVVYRATDFKTNEYRSLEGGKYWEPVEANPMLGFRGAFRYSATPEVFNLELRALKKVQDKYDNISLMIPFVRSPEELRRVRRNVASEGLFENHNFRFLMMVELPVNVIMLDDFIDVGIDGISIGSNDLTMLITGTDRDNSTVASAFDERTPAVMWAIRRAIKTANKRKITSSICGQAPSVYPEMVEKLVEWGITGISVNPDAIERTREFVYQAEKKYTLSSPTRSGIHTKKTLDPVSSTGWQQGTDWFIINYEHRQKYLGERNFGFQGFTHHWSGRHVGFG